MGRSQKIVGRMMKEVHTDTPSTVSRARRFGPKGKEGMLRAIAFSKARKAGAKVPKNRTRRYRSA